MAGKFKMQVPAAFVSGEELILGSQVTHLLSLSLPGWKGDHLSCVSSCQGSDAIRESSTPMT